MTDIPCRDLRIEALRQQLAQWEGAAWRQSVKDLASKDLAAEDPAFRKRLPALSSGFPALDRALPEHGFRPGTLVEWLFHGEGDGTATLAFRAAVGALRAAGRGGGAVVVLDRSGEFYPVAAVALGIEPGAADRRSSRQQGRPHLGPRSGVALSGRGGGGRLAGIAATENSTAGPSAGCNWRPSKEAGWAS